MSHLSKMTVADLKNVANQMSVPFNSRVKKAELVEAISAQIEVDHTRAIEDDEFLFPKAVNLHTDVKIVIDTAEFPMDHGQFTAWYNRHGGMESFDGFKAIEADHVEALSMNNPEATYDITDKNGNVLATLTGVSAEFMIQHMRRVQRFNPLLRKDKSGKVVLTPKQRRRVHKKDRKVAKTLLGE